MHGNENKNLFEVYLNSLYFIQSNKIHIQIDSPSVLIPFFFFNNIVRQNLILEFLNIVKDQHFSGVLLY